MASLGEDLLGTVKKLQDLVFNTIGNDSLDLPKIVWPINLHHVLTLTMK
jgi:dynamin 1-like protein